MIFHNSRQHRLFRDYYQMFRDGLIEDCLLFNLQEVDLWALIPKENIGRLQTVAGMRKMASRMAKEFPGGVAYKNNKLSFSDELLSFAATHRELGSTEQEAINAWRAMQGM